MLEKLKSSNLVIRYTSKFTDVILAIENNNEARLQQLKDAGILTSIKDTNECSILLYYISLLLTPSNNPDTINSHIIFFTQQCPEEAWELYKSCAIQATQAQNYEVLKQLLQSYNRIKPYLKQRALTELKKLYRDIYDLFINYIGTDKELEAYISKLASSGTVDALISWSYTNFPQSAFEINSKILLSFLKKDEMKTPEIKTTICKILFSFINKHTLLQDRDKIRSLYTTFFSKVVSRGYCDLLKWLFQFKAFFEKNEFEELLKTSLIETKCTYPSQLKILLEEIVKPDITLLRKLLAGSVYEILNYIDKHYDHFPDAHIKIIDHPHLISEEVATIEILLIFSRDKGYFEDILRYTIEFLKKSLNVIESEKCMKLLLVGLALHYSRQPYSTRLSSINLHNLSLNDFELNYFITTLFAIKKNFSNFDVNNIRIPLTIALSNNHCLGYETMYSLAQWAKIQHFTSIDLSNNPKLGGGGFFGSSGIQYLANSLTKNTTLRRLNLANCGVNERDFSTLVRMLTLNSSIVDLNLLHNNVITATTIESKLPDLYKHRYKHQLPAFRPNLDNIFEAKKSFLKILGFAEPTPMTVFQQNIRAHIEQSRLYSLGVQVKSKHVQGAHGSFLGRIAHLLHTMTLLSATAGVACAAIEVIKKMEPTFSTLKHGFHQVENLKEALEFFYLQTGGGEILVDFVVAVYHNSGNISDEFYRRYEKYGLPKTMMQTLVDFTCYIIDYFYPLFHSENHDDPVLLFKQFDAQAIAIDVDKTATELAHYFRDCVNHLKDPNEVMLFTDTVAQYFNQFCYDSHIEIDWSSLAQEFSHWVIAKEPATVQVLKVDNRDNRIVICSGDEEEDKALEPLDQSEDEWAIDVIRRRGFQCLREEGRKNDSVFLFNLRYRRLTADNKQFEWVTTDGDRFGYYPIEQKFLDILRDSIRKNHNEKPEERVITIDKWGIEYEICYDTIRLLRTYPLKVIPSGYKPTEEQIKNIQDAIMNLTEKVEALSKITEAHSKEIGSLKQRVTEHDAKHQQADKKLAEHDGGIARIVALEKDNRNKNDKIMILESQVTKLNIEVDTLKEAVKDLKSRLDQVNTAANNAALNADHGGRRAEGENQLDVEHQQRNNNQFQGAPGIAMAGGENAEGNQAPGINATF